MVNRMIGFLVVLAVGVLLSPILVSHYDSALKAEMAKAPPFPDPQNQNDTIEALSARDKVASLGAKKPNGKVHGKATTAWIIQLGNSKDKLSALRLVNQLRAKGYNAFIQQKGAAFGEAVGVFIGPEIKRDSAELMAAKLTKETKLSTEIKSYKLLTA